MSHISSEAPIIKTYLQTIFALGEKGPSEASSPGKDHAIRVINLSDRGIVTVTVTVTVTRFGPANGVLQSTLDRRVSSFGQGRRYRVPAQRTCKSCRQDAWSLQALGGGCQNGIEDRPGVFLCRDPVDVSTCPARVGFRPSTSSLFLHHAIFKACFDGFEGFYPCWAVVLGVENATVVLRSNRRRKVGGGKKEKQCVCSLRLGAVLARTHHPACLLDSRRLPSQTAWRFWARATFPG
ncbi:hypothetical protein LY78DRAFT_281912 [Colletotrichum sublineola]|nr:hypothetical protein LY78DRAFT_281912 [Colletotrichum sublineola]